MIEYRDRLAMEWGLEMVYGMNEEALRDKQTFPDGTVDRIACCQELKDHSADEYAEREMAAVCVKP